MRAILATVALCLVGCATPGGPVASGVVIFEDLAPLQLADFRVIPEEGRALIQPANGRHAGVDGFWWRRKPGEWFKIPAGTTVTVTADLDARVASTPTTRQWQRMKGAHGSPGWRPDRGATAHPTDDPFLPR